jgi:hypothetical protein
MLQPHATDVHEVQRVVAELDSLFEERVQQAADGGNAIEVRRSELECQQGDGNREHAVAEHLQPYAGQAAERPSPLRPTGVLLCGGHPILRPAGRHPAVPRSGAAGGVDAFV